MTSFTLYHNPLCGNSRNTLALLRQHGIEPTIIEYLKTPLSAEAFGILSKKLGAPIRSLMREKEPLFSELNLDAPHWTDAELAMHVAKHPILMNRPIVTSENNGLLCRPAERVLILLESEQVI
jgi:arsenate reductase